MKSIITKLILMLLVVNMACQSGVIPCPKIKTAKIKKSGIHKRFIESSSTLSANATGEKTASSRGRVRDDTKVIKNVSVEEWDCPHPGNKKYMPKHIKANIKRNMELINGKRKNQSDSVSVAPRK